MKDNIEVSVIMSTYNTDENFLRLAIKSIINQSLKNIELIIVNDGGNDLKVIKEFDDKRIVIINHEETMGLPYSLNEAIEKSRGKYIARMDSDDIAKIDRLEIQKRYLDKNSNIDICAMFYKKFYEANDFVTNTLYNYKYITTQLFFRNILAHPTVMFRKSFLMENNLRYSLEYRYSQDFEFWTRCSKKGNIALIPKLGLYYRIHGKQVRSSKKEMQRELYNRVLIRNLQELELDSNNLKYLEMLNGNNKNIEFDKLLQFIELVISKNELHKIYDEKSLKKVLYNNYSKKLLKSKSLNNILIKPNITILFKYINIGQEMKKIFWGVKLYMVCLFDKTLKLIK